VLVWLVLRNPDRETAWRWRVAGALTAVIYLAQPLWLPGIIPIVAVALVRRRRVPWALDYAAVAVAVALAIKIGTVAPDQPWNGPTVGNPALAASLPAVASQIYLALTGSHYLYWAIDPPGPATIALAVIWSGVLATAVLLQLYRLITRRYSALSALLFVSVASTLAAEWLLLAARDARYLLPLAGLLVPLAGLCRSPRSMRSRRSWWRSARCPRSSSGRSTFSGRTPRSAGRRRSGCSRYSATCPRRMCGESSRRTACWTRS
jgi:hypothetical protein